MPRCRPCRPCRKPIWGPAITRTARTFRSATSKPSVRRVSTSLQGIKLRHARRGEVVTLLGRNGAGKTTTLKSIMGLTKGARQLSPSSGRRAAGTSSRTGSRARGIEYRPEERGIFASLTVAENMLLPPAVREGGGRFSWSTSTRCSRTCRSGVSSGGQQAFGRRTADAGDRTDLANRRRAACCSTS